MEKQAGTEDLLEEAARELMSGEEGERLWEEPGRARQECVRALGRMCVKGLRWACAKALGRVCIKGLRRVCAKALRRVCLRASGWACVRALGQLVYWPEASCVTAPRQVCIRAPRWACVRTPGRVCVKAMRWVDQTLGKQSEGWDGGHRLPRKRGAWQGPGAMRLVKHEPEFGAG